MFDSTSRYARLEQAVYQTANGRSVRYIRRRFLPDPQMPLLTRMAIKDGERLDNFTSRTLGDPEHYWRICDANRAMHPQDLENEADRILDVPVPQF